MSINTTSPSAVTVASINQPAYIEWGPIIAGAVSAAAITFVMITFGAAVGFTLVSPWPSSGLSGAAVGVIVAFWTVIVQVASFAGGGYLAGRMRSRWGESATEEGQFRDNAHGFLVWAVGVVIGALLLASASGAGLRLAAQSASTVGAGAAAGMSNQRAGGGAVTASPYELAIDSLMRPSAPGAGAAVSTPVAPQDDTAFRAETGRLLVEVIRRQELRGDDRSYLASAVTRRYGLPQAEAEKRVDAAVVRARDIEIGIREQADKARKAAIIAGFIAAASLLISCAAACAGAHMGGRDRDEGAPTL